MKYLMIYYTFTGNLDSIASLLSKYIDLDILKIELKQPYPEEKKLFVDRVRKELKNNLMPEYTEIEVDLDNYQNIILGVQNWGNTIPPVMKTFLHNNFLEDKTIYPIVTHGGNGEVDIISHIESLTNNNSLMPELVVFQKDIPEKNLIDYINNMKKNHIL